MSNRISLQRVYWRVTYVLISVSAIIAVAGIVLTLILGQYSVTDSPFGLAALIAFPMSMIGGYLLVGGTILFPHTVRKSKKKNKEKE